MFEGNQCNAILNNIEKLKQFVSEKYVAFIETFEAMNEVKKSCFGYKLEADFYKKIKTFELKWTVLKIKHKVSVINKVHFLIEHVPQSIFKTGKPLQNFQNKLLNLAIKNLHKYIDGML